MCSDTEEATVKSAHNTFHKTVWPSCRLTKQDLWKEAQLEKIGDSCQTVWGSDYKVVKTEQDCTLNENHSSFEMNKIMVWTDQLLQIKYVTNTKNIHPRKYEAEVYGRKKTLLQSLKQFHTHFYQLYKKSTTCTMVSLQGLHLGKAFRCPNISASVGLKLFCPWCLKLGRNTGTITIHLREVHYQWQLCATFARHLSAWMHRAF